MVQLIGLSTFIVIDKGGLAKTALSVQLRLGSYFPLDVTVSAVVSS